MALDLVINVKYNMPPGGGITLPGVAPGGAGGGSLAQQIQRQITGGAGGGAPGILNAIRSGASGSFRELNPQLFDQLPSPMVDAAKKLEDKQIRDAKKLEEYNQRAGLRARAMGVRFGLLFGVSSGLYDLTGGAVGKFGPLSSILGMGLSTLPMKFLESGAGLAGGIGIMAALMAGGEIAKNRRAADAFKTTAMGLPMDFMSGYGALRGAQPGLNALGGSFFSSNSERAARLTEFLSVAGRGGMGGRAAVGLMTNLDKALTEFSGTSRKDPAEAYKQLAQATAGLPEGEANRRIGRILRRAAGTYRMTDTTVPGTTMSGEFGMVYSPGETFREMRSDPEAAMAILASGRRREIRRGRRMAVTEMRMEDAARVAEAGRAGALATIGGMAQAEQKQADMLVQSDLKRLDVRQRIAATDKQRHDLEIDGINRSEKHELASLDRQSRTLGALGDTAAAARNRADLDYREARGRFRGTDAEFLSTTRGKLLHDTLQQTSATYREALRTSRVFDAGMPGARAGIRGGAAAGRFGADIGFGMETRGLTLGRLDFETSLTNAQMEAMLQLSTSQFGLGPTSRAARRASGFLGISAQYMGEAKRFGGLAALGGAEAQQNKQRAAEARFRGETAAAEGLNASEEFFYHFGASDADRKAEYEARDAVERQIAYGKSRHALLGTQFGMGLGTEYQGDYRAKAEFDRTMKTPGGSTGMGAAPANLDALAKAADAATAALSKLASSGSGQPGEWPGESLIDAPVGAWQVD